MAGQGEPPNRVAKFPDVGDNPDHKPEHEPGRGQARVHSEASPKRPVATRLPPDVIPGVAEGCDLARRLRAVSLAPARFARVADGRRAVARRAVSRRIE